MNGAVAKTLTDAQTIQQTEQSTIETSLNQGQATDLAEAATQLSAVQNTYQAALAVGSKVGQMSLLNYLH